MKTWLTESDPECTYRQAAYATFGPIAGIAWMIFWLVLFGGLCTLVGLGLTQFNPKNFTHYFGIAFGFAATWELWRRLREFRSGTFTVYVFPHGLEGRGPWDEIRQVRFDEIKMIFENQLFADTEGKQLLLRIGTVRNFGELMETICERASRVEKVDIKDLIQYPNIWQKEPDMDVLLRAANRSRQRGAL